MRPHLYKSLIILTAAALTLGADLAAAAPRRLRADTDGDGALSKAEFTAQRVKQAMRLDSDGDGKISAAEWAARGAGAKAAGAAGRRDPAKAFARLDLNHDGSLDAAELGAAAGKAFDRLDADHDGKLTAAEQRPKRQAAAAQ